MPDQRPKVLFLYTEAAPYVIACLEKLAVLHQVKVHLVRWPVNNEAPFDLDRTAIHVRERDRAIWDLADFVRHLRPDAIFTSGWVDKGYLKICREHRHRGIPVVMCSDTAWRGDLRQRVAALLGRPMVRGSFTHAWVTGEAQAGYARRLGFDADRIRKGFYSADTDRFLPIGERYLQRNSPRPRRFLCVARYISTKGHQYLCDAFAELCDAGVAGDRELWIAGTGELYDQVRQSKSGQHPRITHLGFKQPAEMEALLDQADVFILPSTYEPWGVVVHEHACAAMPLLLSDAVGAAERFLRAGVNGFLFKSGSKDDLKIAMRRMIVLNDAELLAMGRKSHALAREWDLEKWAATAMELIRDRP